MSTSLGLHFGATYLSLVELSKIGRRWQLNNFVHTPQPPARSEAQFFSYLARLLTSTKSSVPTINISLPAHSLFTAHFSLPPAAASRISSAVRARAAALIPLNLDTVTLTWVRQPRTHNIHLTATPRRLTDWAARLSRHLELKVTLTPEVFPLIRAHTSLVSGRALLLNADNGNLGVHAIANRWPLASYNFTSLAALLPVLPQITRRHQAEEVWLSGRLAHSTTLHHSLVALGLTPATYDPRYDLIYPLPWEIELTRFGSALAVAFGLAAARQDHQIAARHGA